MKQSCTLTIAAILTTVAIASVGGVASLLSIVPQDVKADCVEHHNGVATTCNFPGKNEQCTYVDTPSGHLLGQCH